MIWAKRNNERVLAKPNTIATCPICEEELISKCGEIKVWHWSHKIDSSCNYWGEPESQWHIDWKEKFPKEWQEVRMMPHIADIKTKTGLVIELQNSSIFFGTIIERERFYKNMIWILSPRLTENIQIRPKEGNYCTFRWKWPPQSWWEAKKPIYLDLPETNQLFLIKKIYLHTPCGGWGYLISKPKFIEARGGTP